MLTFLFWFWVHGTRDPVLNESTRAEGRKEDLRRMGYANPISTLPYGAILSAMEEIQEISFLDPRRALKTD